MTYWFLDGIQVELQGVSESGNLFTFMLYAWTGAIIIYLIFGGIWVVRRYNEPNMPGVR